MFFHLTPDSPEPLQCSIFIGRCPVAAVEDHFTSFDAAKEALDRRGPVLRIEVPWWRRLLQLAVSNLERNTGPNSRV